ncbi:MAG: hypothetical protein Q8N84_04425 [bacterium]|nr:hypothetical protein [bacterium]
MIFAAYGPIELHNPIANLGDSAGGFSKLLNNVISMIVALASIALFAFLLMGGFQFITAGGDKAQIDGAKKTITNAVIGIIIMSVAFLLVKILGAVLGYDILRLKFGFD